MRRIQIVMDPELDDRLEQAAALRQVSKSALIRECVDRGLRSELHDNGLAAIGALSAFNTDVDAVDIDTELYGPLEADS